jgi:hypothetical protein
MKGTVEIVKRRGRDYFVVWTKGDRTFDPPMPPGFISKRGSITKELDDARLFEGAGEAICGAREMDIAITEWNIT